MRISKSSKDSVEKILPSKGDLSDRDQLIKLASETPAEEFELELGSTLLQFEEWKKDNPGGSYDDFLLDMGLARKKLSGGGVVEDYADLIDAYEKGIDVIKGESLTSYIKRIKAAEND